MPKGHSPFFVGVDIQSAGVAWGCTPGPQTGFIKLPKFVRKDPHSKRLARLVHLYKIHEQYPFNAGPVAVYIEEPFGPNRNTQTVLNQLLATFSASLAANGIPCIQINTSTWKSAVFPKGEPRDKDAIMHMATGLLGRPPELQDEADALLVSVAAGKRWVEGLDRW